MSMFVRAGVLALMLLGPAGFTSAQTPASDRADIESRLARHAIALASQNVDEALTLYTDDAVVRPANMEPVSGKAELRAFFTQWFAAMRMKDGKYTTVELDVHGDTAYQWGTYTFTVTPPGQDDVHDRGSFAIVWKRQPDGSWRYHRGIFNSSLPAAETVTKKR